MSQSLQNEIIGIINYQVGDKLKEVMYNGCIASRDFRLIKCEVIYVHPCGRFYTVEFDFGTAKVRESYTVRSDVNPCRLY